MKELWKQVSNFENYSVSNLGKVRNDKQRRLKATRLDHDGYEKVDLYSNGNRKTYRVHRLVAENFIPNDSNKPVINHKDGIKTNNQVSNLEWVTEKENVVHAFQHNLRRKFCRLYNRSNPGAGRPGTPIRIVETGEEFASILSCAKAINGNDRHIHDCLHRIQQTHRGYHFEYVE